MCNTTKADPEGGVNRVASSPRIFGFFGCALDP